MTENTVVTNPSIGSLLRKAKREPIVKVATANYVDIIVVLRDKGYTFKDIAQWLKDHGAGVHGVSTLAAVVSKAKKEAEHEQT